MPFPDFFLRWFLATVAAPKHAGNPSLADSAPGTLTPVLLGALLDTHRGRLSPRGCHALKHPRVALQRARSQSNGPRDHEAPLPGINNNQGCDCGLHPGRMDAVRPFSARAVPGGHAGECAESTLWLLVPRENFISYSQQGEAPWLLEQDCPRRFCPAHNSTTSTISQMSFYQE
ncbi:uncharacterized protein LOC107650040 isoform X10 [Monodelphis domestica]|uniref:uncharacterized protein LOC107650040 isoform X10 n=1 Tax=Monodelphis domestica TaxID=13616 RepID=UPI0024E2221D|nr:uncharacterized protein LOC107650040 isoform X10 [Monodelphis domestica]